MVLQLDERLRERLRQIRDAQLRDLQYGAAAEDLLVAHEVVAVRDGPGGTSFIGMDGRVIHWNSREPGPAVELTDPQMVASVVVEFAAMHNLPELAELLTGESNEAAL